MLFIYTPIGVFYNNEAITWEVYYTNEDTEPRNWTKITSAASFSYDTVQHRFEISFNSTQARYFKVVYRAPITNPPSFGVTEIEAYGQETIKGKQQTHTKNYTANAGVSYKILENWTTNYHVTYYKTDSFVNSSPTGMNYNLNQGASLSGELFSDLLLTLSYQTSKNRSNQETTSQLYSLNLRYTPLETLATTLTLTHSTTKENGVKTANNNGVVLSTVAEVWEGINVNWDLNANFNEAPQTGTKTNFVFSSLYIRTILTKHLNWDIDYDWQWQSTKDDVTESTSSSSISTTMVYTPSSRVYGRLYIQYNNRGGGSYFSHQYSLGCFLTQKIQMNATSQFTNISDGTSQMMHSLDLIFNLGRKSSFRTGYSYSRTKKEKRQTSHDFYMRFSTGF